MTNNFSVVAVIVTDGKTDYLPQTVMAVTRQTRPCDVIAIVDHSPVRSQRHLGPDDVKEWGLKAYLIEAENSPTMGHAVRQALAEAPLEGDYLWLVHDDSAPADDCLEHLVASVDAADGPVIVGPKQYAPGEDKHLLSAGIICTRYGRRLRYIDASERDQGQHDNSPLITGVGSAGMIVPRQVWDDLKGFNDTLSPANEGLEFCLRARKADVDVQVAPDAVIYHHQAWYRGQRTGGDMTSSYTARRYDTVFMRGLMFGSVAYVLSPLVIIPEAFIRAIWRVLTKNVAAAGKELAVAGKYLASSGPLSRGRVMGRQAQGDHPVSMVWGQSDQRRTHRRLTSQMARMTHAEPLEPIAANAIDQRDGRSRLIGWTIAVIMVVVSALAMRGWMGGIQGGAWTQLPAKFSDLWDVAWGAWTPGGSGFASAPEPLLMVLALMAAPFAMVGMSPRIFLIGLMTFLPAIAAVGAWVGLGAFNRQLPTRALVTVAWVAYPAFLLSLWHGNLAAGLIHAALPWFVWGVGYATGFAATDIVSGAAEDISVIRPRRQASAAGVAAIAAAVIMAANIGLGLIMVAVLLVTGIIAIIVHAVTGHRDDNPSIYDPAGLRYRGGGAVVAAALAPIAVAWPTLMTWRDNRDAWLQILVDQPGSQVYYSSPSVRDLLLGLPIAGADVPFASRFSAGVWMAVVIVIVGIALLGIFQPSRRIAHMCVSVGAIGAALIAYGVTRVPVGGIAKANADNTAAVIYAWPAAFQSLMWLMVLGSAAIALHRVWDRVPLPFVASRIVIVVSALAMIAPATVIGMWAYHSGAVGHGHADTQTMTWPSYRARHVVPLSAELAYDEGVNSRYLELSDIDDRSMTVAMYRAMGPSMTDSSALIRYRHARADTDSVDRDVAQAVATVTKGGNRDATQVLADHGVESIVVATCTTSACRSVVNALESQDGLQRAQKTDRFAAWKVRPAKNSDQSARLIIESATGRTIIPTRMVSASATVDRGASDRQLVLHERYDPHWRVWVDNRQLTPREDAGKTVVDIPQALSGTLTVTYQPWWLTPWRVVAALTVIVALMAAAPIRYRREI